MSRIGIHWSLDGTADLNVEADARDEGGAGQLKGLSPDLAMRIAVVLARSARNHGAVWPQPVWDDTTVEKLRAIADPVSVAGRATELPMVAEVEQQLSQVRGALEAAMDKLEQAERGVTSRRR